MAKKKKKIRTLAFCIFFFLNKEKAVQCLFDSLIIKDKLNFTFVVSLKSELLKLLFWVRVKTSPVNRERIPHKYDLCQTKLSMHLHLMLHQSFCISNYI